MIHGKRQDLRHLQKFCSRACVHMKKNRQGTFASQALPRAAVNYCRDSVCILFIQFSSNF